VSGLSVSLTRLGLIMSADPDDPLEVWGSFNPTVGRTRNGHWHLLARVTALGDVSRLRLAEILIENGAPVGVRRDGVVLAAEEGWEHVGGRGGLEDPRATWVERLGLYVLTYVAVGPRGARPALALSEDFVTWRRLGPLHFAYEPELAHDLNLFANKDVVMFPEPVRAPDGGTAYAFLHRPMWEPHLGLPHGVDDPRHSIWASFVPVDAVARDVRTLVHLEQHRQVAQPRYPFEQVKIGAGPPPVRVPEGWLLVHHGVSAHKIDAPVPRLDYAAGAMLLDPDDVTRVLGRTSEPLLTPQTPEEKAGVDRHIVFPSAIADIDAVPYVFYGVADRHVGVARLERSPAPAEPTVDAARRVESPAGTGPSWTTGRRSAAMTASSTGSLP
jgi:beta-1,2-mannobiose phosphorylase / 1,2-beta-oligomannan phosphorylase